jgi:hypothetical protein
MALSNPSMFLINALPSTHKAKVTFLKNETKKSTELGFCNRIQAQIKENNEEIVRKLIVVLKKV